jgi:hypothetical protein
VLFPVHCVPLVLVQLFITNQNLPLGLYSQPDCRGALRSALP